VSADEFEQTIPADDEAIRFLVECLCIAFAGESACQRIRECTTFLTSSFEFHGGLAFRSCQADKLLRCDRWRTAGWTCRDAPGLKPTAPRYISAGVDEEKLI